MKVTSYYVIIPESPSFFQAMDLGKLFHELKHYHNEH